jgi:hypothetical protein
MDPKALMMLLTKVYTSSYTKVRGLILELEKLNIKEIPGENITTLHDFTCMVDYTGMGLSSDKVACMIQIHKTSHLGWITPRFRTTELWGIGSLTSP